MNQKTNTTPVLISLFHQPQTTTGLPVVVKSGPLVTLPANGRMQPVIVETTTIRPLSELIEIGRKFHPLCRRAFIEKRTIGYYHYEHPDYGSPDPRPLSQMAEATDRNGDKLARGLFGGVMAKRQAKRYNE